MDDSFDFLVCMPAGIVTEFTDNLRAVCCRCGRDVQHRPHVPPNLKKICVDCMQAEASPDDKWAITQKTAEEVAAFLKRQRH